MAEPTSRIEAANSFREPEGQPGSGRNREKARPRVKPVRIAAEPADLPESAESDEVDDRDQHQLDTLA